MATKSNFAQLIDLIKAANPSAAHLDKYVEANLDHGEPTVVSEGAKNTSVTVTGKAAAGLTGTVTVTYDRLDLTQQLTTLNVTGDISLSIPNDGQVNGTISSTALLAPFKAVTGVELLEEDVVVEDITLTDGPAVVDYTLKIKPTSLKWTGQHAVKLTEVSLDIAEDLTATELSGFAYAQPQA